MTTVTRTPLHKRHPLVHLVARSWGRILLVVAGTAAVAGASFIGIRYADNVGWIGIIVILGAAVVLAIALLIPVEWVPAMTLISFVVIPRAAIPSAGILNAVTPISVLLAIWVFRRLLQKTSTNQSTLPAPDRSNTGIRLVVFFSALVFVLWSLLDTVTSVSQQTSTGWLTSFVLGALIPVLVYDARVEARLLRSTWLVLGGICGFYALIELALQRSPIYGPLYALAGVDSSQHWSVYRSEVAFGHPLFAGAFMAIPAALGFGQWLATGQRKPLYLSILSALGVVATVSRGSLLALAISIGIAIIAAVVIEGRHLVRRLLLVAVLGSAAVVLLLGFPPLAERLNSSEADLSTGARDLGVQIALQSAAATNWLGSGPGTSGISGRLLNDVVIENSALQLLISVGIPGLALMGLFVAALVLNALKKRDIASAVAMTAYIISICGFNSIDAVRNMHVVVGLLVILCLNPEPFPLTRAIFVDREALKDRLDVNARAVSGSAPRRLSSPTPART